MQLTRAPFAVLVDGHRISGVEPTSRAYECGLRKGNVITELQAQYIRYAEPDNINRVVKEVSAMLQKRGPCETVPGEQSTGAVPTSYPHQPKSRDQWSTWMDNLLDNGARASSSRTHEEAADQVVER